MPDRNQRGGIDAAARRLLQLAAYRNPSGNTQGPARNHRGMFWEISLYWHARISPTRRTVLYIVHLAQGWGSLFLREPLRQYSESEARRLRHHVA